MDKFSNSLKNADLELISRALLGWFKDHQRELPWRGENDPYKIWISEVMLQQTTVATVKAYYGRFIERFPSLAALAEAELDDVLQLWQGLGYYARARHLHQAARKLQRDYDGHLPDSAAELRLLPGFGDYTSAAVASIAFGQAAPAVDGNARRVLARLFAVDGDVRQGRPWRLIHEIAGRLAEMAPSPGDWTQALMEFGASICTPRQPGCVACPLSGLCLARRAGREMELPQKPVRKILPHYDVSAAVILREDQRILIARRPLKGMLGGLWEFPGGKRREDETLQQCLQREIMEELGVEIQVGEELVCIRHNYSHFRISLYAYLCRLINGEPQPLEAPELRWVEPHELPGFAFPTTDRKIVRVVMELLARPV